MISAGDLVMVTKPTSCCGSDGFPANRVFMVQQVKKSFGYCAFCLRIGEEVVARHPAGHLVQVRRLTKITPDEPLQAAEEREELTA